MINYPIFLYSLIFGIFISYIFQKKKRIIYVYPTPENLEKMQYRDKTGMCFSFRKKNVKCSNNKLLEKYHIQ